MFLKTTFPAGNYCKVPRGPESLCMYVLYSNQETRSSNLKGIMSNYGPKKDSVRMWRDAGFNQEKRVAVKLQVIKHPVCAFLISNSCSLEKVNHLVTHKDANSFSLFYFFYSLRYSTIPQVPWTTSINYSPILQRWSSSLPLYFTVDALLQI